LTSCPTKIPSATCGIFSNIRASKNSPKFSKPYEDASARICPSSDHNSRRIFPAPCPSCAKLYDELLPNFRSRFFNVGCDETFDLGRGRSKNSAWTKGQGRVYLIPSNRFIAKLDARQTDDVFGRTSF